MNKLQIILICTEETSEDYDENEITYNSLEAHILVDDKPILVNSGVVVDISQLIVQYTTPEEIYIHTCGCTVAGCAGIHDPIQLVADDTSVSWIFPETFYRDHINPEFGFTKHNTLKFTFNRTEYTQALDRCVDEIAAYQSGDLPIVIMPATDPTDSILDLPIYTIINNQRVYMEDYWASQKDYRDTYDGFLDKDFKLMFSTQTWNLTADDINYIVTDTLGIHDQNAKREYANTVLMPKLRNNYEYALEVLAPLDIDDFYTFASIDYMSQNNQSHDIDTCKKEWPLPATKIKLVERFI